MKPTFSVWRVLSALFLALALFGCAEQRIRDTATSQLQQGNFEMAIQGLQQGVNEYPESATLRAGLAAARSEAIARLVASAAQQRAAGKFDDAEKTLRRGLVVEPDNTRLLNLIGDLNLARRQHGRLEEANTLIADGKKAKALRIAEDALHDEPRNTEFVALQRRLKLDLRAENGDSGQRSLAEGRPITLDFRNAPLSTVLDAITRGSGINFILDRDVRMDNRVTVFMRNTKVDDALDLVTGANQLARRTIDANTVLIYPNTPEKLREHQEQVIRVFHLANADAKSTAAFLRSMLRIKEPFVDERANMVSIRETPEIVALAERLVALQDVGEAEVMLEVEILEIQSSRLTELGINFPNSVTLTPLSASGATGLTLSSIKGLNDDRIGVSVASLLINLRREVGDVNILANPRIRAKSKEKAHILIGDKVPVITSTTNATGFVAETVSYLDVGLKLDVEPVVSPDDEVTLKMGLEVSTLTKEVHTAAGSLAYQIGTRNANTTLRLRDGETQMLGGLISNQESATSNRVPGLGDLPVLGRLFSSQLSNGQRTELVMAITPHILRNAPRPDISQSELWIGTEMATRLHAAPGERQFNASDTRAAANGQAASMQPTGSGQSSAATNPKGDGQPIKLTWKGPSEVAAGEVFTVRLNVVSGTPLRGAPLELAFPPQSFEIVEVIEGAYFKQDGGVTSFTNATNMQTGRIGVGVLRNDASGVTGQSEILTVRIKAKAAGPADMSLSSFKPIALNGAVPIAELPVYHITVK